MSRFRFPALALSCVVFFSAFSCGCKSKKSKKTTEETRRATALVDDFCAYFKSGKYDKIDKLIGGTSKEFKKLKECNDSGAKDVLEAARKRISYKIGNVTVSDDEGEAVVLFSYFDAEKVRKSITDDSSLSEIKGLVENAKEKEMEFTCKENIYLKAAVVDVPKAVVEKHMDEILEFAELEDFANLPMKRASKGAPALVSLAVHLLKDSDLLLVDEVIRHFCNVLAVAFKFVHGYLDVLGDVLDRA